MDTSHGWVLIQDITALTACVRKMDVDIHPVRPHGGEAGEGPAGSWQQLTCVIKTTECSRNFDCGRCLEPNDSFDLSHCLGGGGVVCANRSAAGNGTAPFACWTGNILPQLHIYRKNSNTERPLNTWKYSNNKTSSGTQTVPLKGRAKSPKIILNMSLLSSTMIWIMDSEIMHMNRIDDSDNHNSRINSLKSECDSMDCEEFSGCSIWECFKEPIRSCSTDPYKSWRTAHGSSSAHGKPGGTVPHCTSSSSKKMGRCLVVVVFCCCCCCFPLLLICLKLQIKRVSFVLICILISLAFSHCILMCPISCQFVVPGRQMQKVGQGFRLTHSTTISKKKGCGASGSCFTLTFPCQPCMYEQSLVPGGRPGLDHREESR